MSYFNSDQQDHLAHLASLPPGAKCDCGWDRRGHCCGTCYGHPERGGSPVRPAAHRHARRHHRAECRCVECAAGGCSEESPCEVCRGAAR